MIHDRRVLTVQVDPIACRAYGYCSEILGELVTLDEWGYPIVSGEPVPHRLVAMAKKAARDCPRRAFLLSERKEAVQLAATR
jgi:ferredoxin